jgi:tetratricopeptide (TPR) repeat protein
MLLVALLLGPLAVAATEQKLELRGQVAPPFRWVPVLIRSTTGSYHKQTLTGTDGKFKFKKLEPGHYTIYVLHRRLGETRHSVEVTPSFADEKGRVQVTVPFRRSQAAMNRQLRQRHMVSFDELAVKDDARDELQKAGKKLQKNDVKSAIAHLEKAVAISPQFIAAWNQLGVIAYQSREYQRAETCFLKALEVDPESFPPTINLGAVLLAQNRLDEALKYNQAATNQRPDDPLANAQLGINHYRLDNDEQAIRYLTATKRIDPAHVSYPQLPLAIIYTERKEWEKARLELENLRKLHPDSDTADMVDDALRRLKGAREGGATEPVPAAGR